MKFTQHIESFCAFDGKIILRVNIAFPYDDNSTASDYINEYSERCLSFVKNILFEHISNEYNKSFLIGKRFEPYLYFFSIREDDEGNIKNYTFNATLCRSGQTISKGAHNVRFCNNHVLFNKYKKHPAR